MLLSTISSYKINCLLDIVSISLSLIIIRTFVKGGRRNVILSSFLICQFLILIWSAGQLFENISAEYNLDERIKWLSTVIKYTAISYVGVSWFNFCFYYSKNITKLNKNLTKLYIIPIILNIFLITNKYHNLYFYNYNITYKEYGIVFWIHSIISYLFLFTSIVLLLKLIFKLKGRNKIHYVLLVLSVSLPLLLNILHTFNIGNFDSDVTGISFTISFFFFYVAVFKYRFLNLIPIAYKNIFENFPHLVITLDINNNIVYINKNVKIFFSDFINNDLTNIQILISFLKEKVILDYESEQIIDAIKCNKFIKGELKYADNSKTFIVEIDPLYKKELVGKIITFSDISIYKALLDDNLAKTKKLEMQSQELLETNKQLSESASMREELSLIKERNRIAGELHDNIGHSFTILKTLLEICRITIDSDPSITKDKITEAISVCKIGLQNLRGSIYNLSVNVSDINDLIKELKKLSLQYSVINIYVNLYYNNFIKILDQKYVYMIYKLCEESLTNALRHGNAKNVIIILEYRDCCIKILIKDDGVGCSNIINGMGLSFMTQRINELGGSITFTSSINAGFNINVQIPFEVIV